MTRKTSSTRRFAVNRAPGESYDAFARRAHRSHTSDALRAKVHEGRWLPPEEYERLTGRPGRRVPPVSLEVQTTSDAGAGTSGRASRWCCTRSTATAEL